MPTSTTFAPGCHFFQRGWLNANHLAFTQGPLTLVDSGYREGLDETLALLGSVGIEPGAVERIVTTHIHCDHVGGHQQIHQASGCAIALHPAARWAIEHRDGWATWHQFYQQAYEFFPCHQDLDQGDEVKLGDIPWRVIHAPGHCAAQICLHQPDLGWLIAADAVWDGDFGVLTLAMEGWQSPLQMADTLERLAGLNLTTVFPGHGPIIEDGPGAVARCRERLARFLEKPILMAEDQMRKILLYQLLMHAPITRAGLRELVQGQPWYRHAVRRWFSDEGPGVMDRFLASLEERGLVIEDQGSLFTPLPA